MIYDLQKRIANVAICNETEQKILSIEVLHKYSDVYNNRFDNDGEGIDNRACTMKIMKAEYHTGDFTTGRDWWMVTWTTEDGLTHLTSPHNYRGTIDTYEKIGGQLLPIVSGLALQTAITSPEPTTKAIAAAIATTTLIANSFINSESTAGYKQHILREEDASNNKIILTRNEVKFVSNSGESSTGVFSFRATQSPDNK
ncbi:hypothetical protein PSI22_13690 [Xenorhabdus sp. XENO-7]|uniref:Up-regulated in Daf-2 domain-containing protein n=1 Tax=Xenorhabdus aichiensis TaxID=3025874 RepID=A0ABT5M4M8_9GAMM|nr:hypothetical protein [Xenorhabdus aichiensis]MDC9622658.1 hypothetical protein [Xenorhabdus aichiensis]